MIFTKQKSDELGAMASALCLVHCVATPFLFIVQSCSVATCSKTPTWWGFIDSFFLIISFFAIYRSAQTSGNSWVKPVLWVSWGLLFFIIVNEKIAWFSIPEYWIYIPAIALIVLHLYNRKYCQCNSDKCCTNEG
ncbi:MULTISPECIES: MerC domain-containing protein [Winogradskyella]|uniref:MerC domain-containing protein n=1 Tax=Winogradskyella TaxID=286104 RepID=UPI0015CC935A|nr:MULTISPECIES: MerC domain-containing protein [Winogradskyella]QXP80324.1 MerC domain-containing protein [Winogradskyella sp. HaHa_3_26]